MLKGTGFGWFLFCFLLSVSAITYYGPFTHLVFGVNSYSYIMTKCKTEGNLSLSFFTVSYAVNQEVQTEYVIEFTMSDKTPFLSVDVAWLGNKAITYDDHHSSY